MQDVFGAFAKHSKVLGWRMYFESQVLDFDCFGAFVYKLSLLKRPELRLASNLDSKYC